MWITIWYQHLSLPVPSFLTGTDGLVSNSRVSWAAHLKSQKKNESVVFFVSMLFQVHRLTKSCPFLSGENDIEMNENEVGGGGTVVTPAWRNQSLLCHGHNWLVKQNRGKKTLVIKAPRHLSRHDQAIMHCKCPSWSLTFFMSRPTEKQVVQQDWVIAHSMRVVFKDSDIRFECEVRIHHLFSSLNSAVNHVFNVQCCNTLSQYQAIEFNDY